MPGEARLKLRAEDDEDLAVIGAVLQDALVPLADMLYEPADGRFALVLNRFVWERPGEPAAADEDEPGERFARAHAVLTLHEVESVRMRGIDRRDPLRPLCLLTIRAEEGVVRLEFAGGGTIRIAVRRIRAFLEDVGEPWTTRWRPAHPEI